MDFSGLSRSEAERNLEEKIDNMMNEEIIFRHGEYEKKYTLKTMELETDMIDKVYEACTVRKK